MEKDKKIMYDAWIEDIIDEVKNKSGDYWQKYFENPFYRGVLKRLVKDTRMVKGDQYHDQHQLKFDGINYEDFDHNKFHILLYTLYGLDGEQWGHLHTTYLFILKHIKDTQGEDNILSESTNESYHHLKKIADLLYKNTLYDRKEDTIVSPVSVPGVAIRSSMNFTIYHDHLWGLRNYLEEIFGLVSDDADNVWTYYKNKMREYDNRENRYHLTDELMDGKDVNRLDESKDNTTKFVEKIAKEIIGASTLSGKLLYFYPPVVEESKDEGPISADVNSEWIHNDRSTGIYHLTTDIRRIGRLYINKIMGPGIDREDPIFKQVNDIVIDNILKRARNHDWMKEVGGMRDLRDKHGFLRESKEDVYEKIANRAVKESRLIKSNGKLFLKSPAFESGVNVETVLNIMGGRAKRSIPNSFLKYMKEIFNIEKKGYNTVIHTIWRLYSNKIVDMILEANPDLIPYYKRATYLNESKEDKSKNYREKVYRDLVKKTKWRDDSYREIDVDGVCNKINSYIEWGSSGAYFYVIPPCIEDLLMNVYGLTYSEMDRFFWDWYEEHIIYMLISKKEYLPPHIKRLNLSYLNESKDARQGEFLNYVLEDLMNNTTWKDASYTILLLHGQNISTSINYDTFTIDWIPGKVDEIFTNMGLDDGEKRMIWEIYKEFVLDKMISEGNNTWLKKHLHMRRYPYLNESVDSVEKNKPYLDKVVDKLKHYTTFAASKSHVYRPFYTAQIPFTGGQKWYIEWFSNSLETGYGFKDGFKKEMRDVYGLTPEEIEYVYMKFTSYLIKEFEGRYTKVHVVKDQ